MPANSNYYGSAHIGKITTAYINQDNQLVIGIMTDLKLQKITEVKMKISPTSGFDIGTYLGTTYTSISKAKNSQTALILINQYFINNYGYLITRDFSGADSQVLSRVTAGAVPIYQLITPQ